MAHSIGSALTFCEVPECDNETRTWLDIGSTTAGRLNIGDRINGRYVLVDVLGAGGMGRVYLAWDSSLHRNVALKVNLASADCSAAGHDPADEAKLAAQFSHPAIAAVYDTGSYDGQPYTIFEYVEGENLRKALRSRGGVWPLDDIRALLKPIAEALDFAHAKGIVHSDLKPENICLSASGIPKILDFGVATRLHATARRNSFFGTPAYASPEQAGCKAFDGRSDQYSLAVVAYELLTGRRPFLGTDPVLMLQSQMYDIPIAVQQLRKEIPSTAAESIMRALSKSPHDRFATCREFAMAFESNLISDPTVGTYLARTDVHITQVQSESLVAKTLAGLLESRGYRCWYYQRDAIPGIPLSRQVKESLWMTRVSLLLISRSSLINLSFAEEIGEASRLHRPCLPVLIDMSVEEFESHHPNWRPLLGSAAVIELQRNDLEHTLERILRAIEVLGIYPSRGPTAVESHRKPTLAQIWATDSNQIDNRELQRVVFRSDLIDDYLNRPNKHFLSATKGLGKTLLMKYKRHLLTSKNEGERSVTIIPSGRPYLDFMSEMKSLSKHYETQLSDLTTCKRLWGAALRIAALSHHGQAIPEDQQFELKPFPQRIQRWLMGAKVEPTVVFKELTNLPISDVNRLIDGTENFLDEQIRHIHDSTLIFIDKVDQAVRQLSRWAWINIQAGLIEAAWDLMSANSHVKVFASIRQEAFVNYQSDIKSNLLGATTMLRYGDDDMRALMDQLANCYEGTNGFKSFIGVNVIKHPRRPFPEDSFEFLKRYTFGRPRDFVAIAAELSSARNSLDEKRFCDLVRQTSGSGLVPSLFDESKVFLDCLYDKANQLNFLGLLETNILTRQQAVLISRRFNGLPVDGTYAFDEESNDIFHPFRDLYMLGLLGYISRNDQDELRQRFRRPDDSLSATMADLPMSTHYFVHPALSEYIQMSRPSSAFRIIQQILVGDQAAWHSIDPIILQIECALEDIKDIGVRNSVHEFLGQAKGMKLSANPQSLQIEMESSRKWKEISRYLIDAGNDDVVLWFEALVE